MTMITDSRTQARSLTLAGLFAAMAGRLNAFRSSRHTLRGLEAMDDHLLKDIGLSRADVVQAAVAELGTDRMAMLGRARNRRMA